MVLQQIKKRFKLPYVFLSVNCDGQANHRLRGGKIKTGLPLGRGWYPNMINQVDYLNNY